MSGSNREFAAPARHRGRRTVITSLAAATVSLLLATPAAAGPPRLQACLGEDIRAYAQGGSGFGAFVSGMATTTDGVGTEIQAHLAGSLSDAIQPNSCND
jgi:hypothetical protein